MVKSPLPAGARPPVALELKPLPPADAVKLKRSEFGGAELARLTVRFVVPPVMTVGLAAFTVSARLALCSTSNSVPLVL